MLQKNRMAETRPSCQPNSLPNDFGRFQTRTRSIVFVRSRSSITV